MTFQMSGWEENKPTSLGLVCLRNSQKPRKVRKPSQWLVKYQMDRSSETDSIFVSTNVIRIGESKDMMGRGAEHQNFEGQSPPPLDSEAKKAEQKRAAKCPLPKSLEGSSREIEVLHVLCEEEAEDPMSSDYDDEEAEDPMSYDDDEQEEVMEHSIPDSYDE